MAEQWLPIHGLKLRVDVSGDPDAPPLALLNGAYCNIDSWAPVMPALLPHFRIIRHDWRGSGRSEAGTRADYTFAQYASDLAAILDALDVERLHVCGLAYGARAAARFALDYPQRVERLALFDVSLDQPVDQALQHAGNAEALRLREAAGLPSVERDPAWFVHDDPKEAMRSLTAHLAYEPGVGAVPRPDPTDELAACAIPTLIACGRQDANLPEAERIAALIPDARLEIMEMAGHGSQFSRPGLVAAHLIDFMR